jgi:hypothetical protein
MRKQASTKLIASADQRSEAVHANVSLVCLINFRSVSLLTASICQTSQQSKRYKRQLQGNLGGQRRAIDHTDNFFEGYPNFKYDQTAPIRTSQQWCNSLTISTEQRGPFRGYATS